MSPDMEGTDSKCPPTLQVRRGHPTVHSETKYVELIVINDHQLVSPRAKGDPGRRGPREPCLLTPPLSQFEQMRQSVVLTSNFAKSVVNLADVVSSTPTPLSPSFSPPPYIQASMGHCQSLTSHSLKT